MEVFRLGIGLRSTDKPVPGTYLEFGHGGKEVRGAADDIYIQRPALGNSYGKEEKEKNKEDQGPQSCDSTKSNPKTRQKEQEENFPSGEKETRSC